ncbi:MAG TPA: ATP-dependent DNA helicase RecG [Candidatus Absconditabacterales bacterium]|nr:ATP-dependent DNA helicase RecG [Candidatus Absconditabacterales bacterium]
MTLKTDLKTTPRYVNILQKNGIETLRDFLQYFPRDYEDRENIIKLDQINLQDKMSISVKGFITEKKFFQRGRKKIYDIRFRDENGDMGQISIYNASFLASKLQLSTWYVITGKPSFRFGRFVFSNPQVTPSTVLEDEDVDKDFAVGRIYPIYPEMNGIKPGWFAEKIWNCIGDIDNLFEEYLPKEFLKKFDLIDVKKTIRNIHYPIDLDTNRQAKHRIFFDRLLRIQLYSLINRDEYQKGLIVEKDVKIDWSIVKEIVSKLAFELTGAQKKALKIIVENIHDQKPMMRLLQGDVGSGKTVVAAIAAYYVYKKFGGQSVFLAPLEVLANQHHKTLAKLLLPLGLRIEILKGSLTKDQKDKIKSDLRQGKIHLLVGTHAVLQDDVDFKDLKFVIIDEQHKFGVKQRAVFHQFGNPHILQMSATPIPRSMALAFFGEFDVSVIDEMPKGRKEIYTKIISEKEYIKLKQWVLTRIMDKQKVFVVTPLIEESEKMEELKAATVEFENVKELFPELKDRIGLLHGKMKSSEKDQVMKDFQGDKYDILVSTTVIEVGVDVPEATVMVIKNAERFGLSQLHQLRGRIGRNELQSYCFLETKKKSGDTYKRLKAMEDTNDGFKLAELDLQNRGAGEILGTMQSGEADIPLEVLSDIRFIEKVREGAEWLLKKYPGLEGLGGLKNQLDTRVGKLLV